jgi:hypothetical protein
VFYKWFVSYPVVLEQNDEHIIFGDLAFGAGADGVDPSFELQIDLNSASQARAWLIWRNNQKTELTQQ